MEVIPPDISVTIVICHHTGDLIYRCLDSLWKSHVDGLKVTIVVVTSTDQVFDGATTLKELGGPAHKRNVGVHWYGDEAKYLIFLDDDVELDPNCIWNLVDEMEQHPYVGMGFCKILNMERRTEFDDCGSWITSTGFLWARAGNGQQDRGQFDQAEPCLASKSATCITRRDSFFQAGGFDADYFILGEETDLAWRIWLLGQDVWYFPSARSWHAFGTSLKPKSKYYTLDRIHFHGAKNYINLLLTNLGALRLCLTFPIHVSVWFASAVLFAVRGQLKRSSLIFRGIFWNVTHLKTTLNKRRRVQMKRQRTDRELWPLVSKSPGPGYYLGRLCRYVVQGIHG